MKSFQTRKYHWLTKKITSPYTSEKKTTTSFPGSWKWGCGNGCERLELLSLLISKMAEASSSTSHSNPSNPVVFFDIAIGGQVKTSFCFSFQLLNVKLKVLFKHRTTFLSFSLHVQDVGRMKMELFADVVPKTAENIRWVFSLLVYICMVRSQIRWWKGLMEGGRVQQTAGKLSVHQHIQCTCTPFHFGKENGRML